MKASCPAGGAATPGKFASTQWRDPNLEHARKSVSIIDDQRCEEVSNLTFPHFKLKNGLLYRVVTAKGGYWCLKTLCPKCCF